MLAVGLMLPATAAMAIPSEVTVQGYLRTQAGTGGNGTYALTLTLWDAQSGGTALWNELQVAVDVTNGLFSTTLGADAVGNPLMLSVFRDTPRVWLGIAVEAGPGVPIGGEAELPRTPMTSVGYAYAAMHADVAAVATDVNCVGCVSETELGFDVVTEAELTAALAALPGPVTSVDGLTGGTISGAVTVTGAVAAPSLSQNGNTVCDSSGNCGQLLASTVCADGQTLTYNTGSGMWGCSDPPTGGAGTPVPCVGQYMALQFDGTDWSCVDVRNTGLSGGSANGYELTDDWGYVFDGIQRAPKNWAQAKADCEARGGRLPTATELYRNNAGPTGTGNVGEPQDTAYLWTLIADYRGNHRVTIRLNDGAVNYYDESTTQAYRCVWPDYTSTVFNGDYCYGPPGSECKSTGYWWNTDKIDRPAMTYAAAVNECSFYNASLPDQQDFARLTQAGWENGTNNWQWLNETKYWYNGNFGYAVGRWTTDPEPWWGYDSSQHGTLVWGYNNYNFRCIGKRSASEGTLPASPACNNSNCYTMSTGRRARIIADNEDRPAATLQDASQTCRLLGGSLPKSGEIAELIHDGWENGTNNWLWTQEPIYWYASAYGYAILRFDGTLGERWYIQNNSRMERSYPQDARNYRCVWHEYFGDPATTMTTCAAGENQVWDGSAFTCEAAVDGDSAGNANPVQAVDGWGNAWDLIQRGATSFSQANTTCTSLGGRLPTATELYRVRNQASPLSITIADATSTSYIWTLNPGNDPNERTTLRMSDGSTSIAGETANQPYRCVWPTTKGEAYTGRSCFGEPAAPCYQDGRIRVDKYDRAPVYAAAAAWECNFFGGELADGRQFLEYVHRGAPNGSGTWNWINRPIYWYNGNYGYALGAWSGTGTVAWGFHQNGNGAITGETSVYPFRCVFTDEMK